MSQMEIFLLDTSDPHVIVQVWKDLFSGWKLLLRNDGGRMLTLAVTTSRRKSRRKRPVVSFGLLLKISKVSTWCVSEACCFFLSLKNTFLFVKAAGKLDCLDRKRPCRSSREKMPFLWVAGYQQNPVRRRRVTSSILFAFNLYRNIENTPRWK